MATAGNPFGGAGGGGNPFDPFVGGATAAQQPGVGAGMAPGYGAPNPYQAPPGQAPGGAPAMQQYPNQQPAGMAPSQSPYQQQAPPPAQPPAQPDPWGAPQAAQPVQQQFQPQAGAYGQPQPAQTYQQPSQAAGGYDPFGATQAPAGQMVVSQQQSNPYAGLVAPTPPTPTPDYGAQAIVPAQQPANPWGVQQQQQVQPPPAYGAPPPASGGYDPFASAPVPAPAPPPAPVAQQPAYPAPQAPVAAAPPSNVVDENPFGPLTPVVPQETQIVPSQQQQMQQYSSERTDDSNSRAIVPAPANGTVRNQYAGELARKAPPGASPLPKAELVKKRGYVLSRISFRTIVMKKWKQSYWVQYGSHTMLWFRSQSDFEDWLNNPYHSQAQRNFLIKLAVNFVHDLYKPNVRGYQVTQCRVKPYGNKTVRQFKLERWMDYGPTIAAAFGAYDPKEVDALREAIVECMRNTPLDGGIRATGAVRQMPDAHNEGAPIAAQDNNDYQSSDMHERFNSGGKKDSATPIILQFLYALTVPCLNL